MPFCWLLLAEPESCIKRRLYEKLDFSGGEPRIPGVDSRALIFPADSLCRIFSDVKGIAAQKAKFLSAMKSGEKYRIATGEWTDLTFEARKWIPLDFEICTAPVENSINGKIVADGAVFFKKIGEKLTFIIKNGRIDSVSAESPAGEGLLAEYRNMTAADMKNPANTQLAEIGIGFCPGAEITDCFMEAEAALKTCHFCFGNNIYYGGENESDFHGASVLIKNPVFTRMD